MSGGSKIRVAIVGGGLGGTVLMNNLMKYSHLDVNIYEAKDTFKERGASVGLAPNALRALKMMGMEGILRKAGAVPANSARSIIGEGPDKGKLCFDWKGGLQTVHRAALLRELMASIPEDRMHTNKKLVDIDGQTIVFEDGTTATADVVIGADGIHSSVRRYVLGADNPAIEPINAGIFDCRNVVPFETALARIGAEHLRPEEPCQRSFIGNDMLIFFDFIDESSKVCIVFASLCPSEWDKKKWKHEVSREWLMKRYEGWPDFIQEMVKLLCGDEQTIPAFIEWESAEASHIYNGTVCVMGDAAHATTPWQGAGLGQAIEDALVIQAALGQCRTVEDVPVAFKAFDELMRPRGRRIVESSRRTGLRLMGKEGLDSEHMLKTMLPMWDFIHYWDTEEAVAMAVNAVQASREGKEEC